MLRKQFNEDWTVSSNAGGSLVEAFLNGKKEEKKVTLPHDAMVEEEMARLIPETAARRDFIREACTTMERSFLPPRSGKRKRLSWSWKVPI